MPADGNIQTLTASTTTENLLAGRQYERVPGPLKHMVRVIAAGLDGAAGDITLAVTIGQRTIKPAGGLSLNAGGPSNDADGVAEGMGMPGDLIQLRAVNTNVANRIIGWRVILSPVI